MTDNIYNYVFSLLEISMNVLRNVAYLSYIFVHTCFSFFICSPFLQKCCIFIIHTVIDKVTDFIELQIQPEQQIIINNAVACS